MVQLIASSVASTKSPKMAKAKTPKKSNAVATPIKTEVKTPKQAKNTPAKAVLQTPKTEVKTPKQAKNTPAKAALQTPKTEVKTPKQAKNTPVKAALQTPKIKKEAVLSKSTPKVVAAPQTPKMKESLKEAKSTPKAALQTPKNGAASAKKAYKVKTPKQKPAEDVEMASEGEEEAAPAAYPVMAQPSPKRSAKKETVKSEDAEMSSEEEEITVKPKSTKSAAAEEKINSKTIGEYSISIRRLNALTKKVHALEHFSLFGKVTKCAIPRNPAKKGLNKGFGIIEFDSQEAMDKAMAATHTLQGRTLIITKSSEADVAVVKRKRNESTQRGGDRKRQASTSNHELFVNKLSLSTTKDTLQEHFAQFGKVVSVDLPKRPDESKIKGFAFITFKDASSLQKAMAVSDQVIDSSKVVIEPRNVYVPRKKAVVKQVLPKHAHPNELFVRGLNYLIKKDTLQEYFSKYGKVSNITLRSNRQTNDDYCFCFVSFESAKSLAAALEDNHEIDGQQVDVKSARAIKEALPKLSYPNELFVEGLNHATQKHTLKEHFSNFGKVSNITLPWNKDADKNKGFGFVSFESAESLAAALEENHKIDGKKVGVRPAGAKSEENGAASKKVDAKKVKAASAATKIEEDDDEEVEEEEADSEDEEVEGEEEEEDDDEAEDEESDDDDDEEEDVEDDE